MTCGQNEKKTFVFLNETYQFLCYKAKRQVGHNLCLILVQAILKQYKPQFCKIKVATLS